MTGISSLVDGHEGAAQLEVGEEQNSQVATREESICLGTSSIYLQSRVPMPTCRYRERLVLSESVDPSANELQAKQNSKTYILSPYDVLLALVDNVLCLLSVLGQLGLRVGNLLLQGLQLLLLLLPDIEVLAGTFALGEGITLSCAAGAGGACVALSHPSGNNGEAANRGRLRDAWQLAGDGCNA